MNDHAERDGFRGSATSLVRPGAPASPRYIAHAAQMASGVIY